VNLEHVASYLAVLRTGTFHAAARERKLSQASVSQHVRALEQEHGAALVVRDRAGCRPVTGTEEFARYAALLLAMADRATHSLRTRSLRVGASSNIGTYLIHPAFGDFSREVAGSVDTRLIIGTNAAVADQLEIGEIDVAVMEWWDDRPGCAAVPWCTEEVVVITSADHEWSSRTTVGVEELASERILGGEPQSGTATMLRERLGAAAGDLEVAMSLGSTEAVKRAVRHGLGVSLVLRGAVRDEVQTGTIHALQVDGARLEKTLWAVTRHNEPPSSPSRQFVDRLLRTPAAPAR
jgi:DNA-binding transcriptional LysR family regulator